MSLKFKKKFVSIGALVVAGTLLPIASMGDDKTKKEEPAKKADAKPAAAPKKPTAGAKPGAPAKKPAPKAPEKKEPESKESAKSEATEEAPPKRPSRAAADSKGRLNDFSSAAELAKTFRGFEVVVSGTNPNLKVELFGRLFDDCKGYFQISNTAAQSDLKASTNGGLGGVGFIIADPQGRGRDCMASHEGELCTDSTCTGLSKMDGTSADFSGQDDALVGLLFRNPNSDRHPIGFESLTAKPILHESRATAEARSRAEAARARADLILNIQETITTCRKNESELRQARNARKQAEKMGLFSSEEFDEIDRQLKLAELGVMTAQIGKTPLEGLEDLREKLFAWGEENPEMSEYVASAFHLIAKRYVAGNPQGLGGFTAAKATIQEARKLGQLSDRSRSTLAHYEDEIDYAQVERIAGSGLQGNMLFMPYYGQLMQRLQQNVLRSTSLEARSNALAAYQKAAMLPQMAAQVDQSRQALYAEMQRAQQMAYQQPGFGQMPGQGQFPGGGLGAGMPGQFPGGAGGFPGQMPGQGQFGGGQFPGQLSGMPGGIGQFPTNPNPFGSGWNPAAGSGLGSPGAPSFNMPNFGSSFGMPQQPLSPWG